MKYTDKVQCININNRKIKYFDKNNIPSDYVIRKGSLLPPVIINQKNNLRYWSKQVRSRDNFCCQICGVKCGVIHAHHILYKKNYPQFQYEVDNGITLCLKHHLMAHDNKKWFQKWLKDNFEYLYDISNNRIIMANSDVDPDFFEDNIQSQVQKDLISDSDYGIILTSQK